MNNWDEIFKAYYSYLFAEYEAENTHKAYINDFNRFKNFLESNHPKASIFDLDPNIIDAYIKEVHNEGLARATQARIIYGLRIFYTFLDIKYDEALKFNPTARLEGPKIIRKLPDVLSVEEINSILNVIDLSSNEGHRNRAIIEVLYGCGLRVSELVDLKITHIYLALGYIRVTGKGNKERLVPIGDEAVKYLKIYITLVRNKNFVDKSNTDVIFLNRFGKKISRISIFTIVKEAVKKAGITKNVSPHSFRHSFATHMIDRGADIRAIQEILGHSSITTTEIYTHLDTKHLQETLSKFHPRFNL